MWGESSSIGTSGGSPYTAGDDQKTMPRTPAPLSQGTNDVASDVSCSAGDQDRTHAFTSLVPRGRASSDSRRARDVHIEAQVSMRPWIEKARWGRGRSRIEPQ